MNHTYFVIWWVNGGKKSETYCSMAGAEKRKAVLEQAGHTVEVRVRKVKESSDHE